MRRGLGIQLALNQLAGRRGINREQRRLFRIAADDDLIAEFIADSYEADINAASGPSLPVALPEGAMGALGDGGFVDWIEKVFQWFLDEENRAKVEALIKWIMSIFAMFGGI